MKWMIRHLERLYWRISRLPCFFTIAPASERSPLLLQTTAAAQSHCLMIPNHSGEVRIIGQTELAVLLRCARCINKLQVYLAQFRRGTPDASHLAVHHKHGLKRRILERWLTSVGFWRGAGHYRSSFLQLSGSGRRQHFVAFDGAGLAIECLSPARISMSQGRSEHASRLRRHSRP